MYRGLIVNKISIQRLNGILDFTDSLVATVIWVRDINYKKQLYVSHQYEQIWGRPTIELYNHPSSFSKTLLSDGNCPRSNNNSGLNLYRILKPGGQIGYIKDQHFLLIDDHQKLLGNIGFADEISERLWIELLAGLDVVSTTKKTIQNEIVDIIKKEFYLNLVDPQHVPLVRKPDRMIAEFISKRAIQLTPREQVCLSFLLAGNLPKQIAVKMNISIRTIEYHLSNIKRKCKCRNTLQLVSKVNGYC